MFEIRDELQKRLWKELYAVTRQPVDGTQAASDRAQRLRVPVVDFLIYKEKYSMGVYVVKDGERIEVFTQGYAGPGDIKMPELARELLWLLRQRQILNDIANAS